jgi:TolA-binding protein
MPVLLQECGGREGRLLKKALYLLVIVLIVGVVYLGSITTWAADKAFLPENQATGWAPLVAYEAGQINVYMFNYAEAIRILEAAMRVFPNESWVPDAHFHVGLCYQKSNRPDRAAEWFQALIHRYPDHRWVPNARKALSDISVNKM